jgi:hypothetical protein
MVLGKGLAVPASLGPPQDDGGAERSEDEAAELVEEHLPHHGTGEPTSARIIAVT